MLETISYLLLFHNRCDGDSSKLATPTHPKKPAQASSKCPKQHGRHQGIKTLRHLPVVTTGNWFYQANGSGIYGSYT